MVPQVGQKRRPDQAGHERHLTAEQVSQLAAQKQQAAERQRVRGDHPLPVHDGEPQIALRGRQRDVHDRRVEHDHELRQSDHPQDQPPVFRRGGPGICGLGHGVPFLARTSLPSLIKFPSCGGIRGKPYES